MKPVVTIISAEDRVAQYLGASLTIAGLSLLIGLGSYPSLGLTGLASAASLGLASGIAIARIGLRRHNEVLEARRRLEELSNLLAEGVEAEPGRVTLDARYTGEGLPRGYSRLLTFRPTGDPTVVDLEMLEEWKPRYTLIIHGHVGLLEAEAYRVKLEDTHAYMTVIHDGVSVKVSRDRLIARYGSDYAEALIEAEGPILSCIVSHVGRRTRATLILDLASPLGVRVRLASVHGRAERIVVPFAPYTPHIILFASSITPGDIASALGSSIIMYGGGVDARVRLLLKRGARSLDMDEATVKTSHTG